MRAITVHQPWADLLVSGTKTEIGRSWKISHRGPLAIHASLKVDQDACSDQGINPDNLTTGAIVGHVNLFDIVKVDDNNPKTQSLNQSISKSKGKTCYQWLFNNPQPLENPVPATGRKGIFHVPDELFSDDGTVLELTKNVDNSISLDSRAPFEMRVINEPNGKPLMGTYRIAIFQRNRNHNTEDKIQEIIRPYSERKVSELGGISLKIVADVILEALRKNEYSATELNPNRKEPFFLSEESGVRLALIFLAIQSLKKTTRIEEISHGIQAMTPEELYYWFAKCTSTRNADRALKALRLLLSEE